MGYAVVKADGGYEYLTSGVIKTGDGFFVKSISNNPVLTYNKEYQSDNNIARSINIIASGDNGNDNLIICMSDEGHEGFPKLNNLNESIANVYVANNDKRYGIYNCSEDVKEINVDFKANEEGSYTLHFDIDGEFDMIALIDNANGEETDMLVNDYTFTSTAQDASNRFVVRFSKDEGLTENNDHKFVYQSGEELIINAEGAVQIIDMMGRIVYSKEISSDARINTSDVNTAAYIVRLVNGDGVKTQKIVVM